MTVVAVNVTEPPSAATSAPVSPLRTPRNGIVTLCCSPVSGFEVIGPSNGGKPVPLLIITTATSPASSPKTARATRAHVPRFVTTTMPAVPAYWALLQPSETVPSAFRSTLTVNDPLGSAALLALMAETGPPARLSVAPG